MIPARIGRAVRKNFTIPDGVYTGYWQDYFCWIYAPGTKDFIYRFDTATKCQFKRGETVTIKVNVCTILIYETL
jgi:hypothetical protein